MTELGSRRGLVLAQAGVRRDMTTVLRAGAETARGVLPRFSDSTGRIPERKLNLALAAVGQTVSDLFTGRDNRSAFGDDGVLPFAPYPRVLNQWIAFACYQAVIQHTDWLQNNAPRDVFQYLKRGRRTVAEAAVSTEALRHWEAPHRWQDERGYRLSDRIWRADMETRRKIDELLTRGIRAGRGALDLAAALEAYLVPGRSGIRTLKPYGRGKPPGGASYDAMRLARTEIAHAFNTTALISAQMNPFVEAVDVARSGNGDPTCKICPQHATIGISGDRLRPPYPKGRARIGPYHSHCMCHVRPVVFEDRDAVSAAIREQMARGEAYSINPADEWAWLEWLLGLGLTELVREQMAA